MTNSSYNLIQKDIVVVVRQWISKDFLFIFKYIRLRANLAKYPIPNCMLLNLGRIIDIHYCYSYTLFVFVFLVSLSILSNEFMNVIYCFY